MQYRPFGTAGFEISALGFGAMRLPFEDETESIAIMQRAFDQGVNYVDTAFMYGGGKSESLVGKALRGYRDRVRVASKFPTWNAQKSSDYRRILDQQLRRLELDCLDDYYFHGLNQENFQEKVLGLGLLEEAQRARDQGLIRHLAFSFHDRAEVMQRIIDTGVFDAVLCQYNLLDRSNQAAMAYAHQRGLGVLVMGPIGGGRLGGPSRTIQSILPGKPVSTPELALRFVLANPHVSCALSGMGSRQMVDENVAVASSATKLTTGELERIEAAAQENARLAELYCTDCSYCMPCPEEVNIPLNFRLMNLHRVYDVTAYARAEYAKIGTQPWMPGKRADQCTQCGTCETKCPQKLAIREQLLETARTLGVWCRA
jgi:predicted aldo/keto reductase-like oxidoreductase